MTTAYREVVHWRNNICFVPSGMEGKAFIRELARLYQVYIVASTPECFGLKAYTVLQLLLQKPHAESTAKEHAALLE